MTGNLRYRVGGSRKPLSKKNWEEVMTAGMNKYPIGKLLDANTNNPRVVFSAPPGTRDGRVEYHNMLVDLCHVSLRDFSSLLRQDGAVAGDVPFGDAAAAAAMNAQEMPVASEADRLPEDEADRGEEQGARAAGLEIAAEAPAASPRMDG